eukprot:4086442-Pleurochrysis_carterae.AAC.1
MRLSTTTPALPAASHHRKHCVHGSAHCTGQNLLPSPSRTCVPHMPMIASALASACTFGSAITRSASGTPALTQSRPP